MSAQRKPALKPTKPYWEMTTEELREATKEFNQEFISDTFRPMTAAERKEWDQLRKRRRRDLRKLTIRVTPEMLDRIERLAKRWKRSRSEVVRCGLDSYLTKWLQRTEKT